MYPVQYRTMFRHWMARFVFFLAGILLLYAPFALLTRLILWATHSPLLADSHRICLRMPIQWLLQPWMYSTMVEQPVYLVAVLVLPLLAFFLGPLFCGWMCPAGQMTEFLSRIVPPRFQLNPGGKLDYTPIRYGFAVGMLAAPMVSGNACCSFCNFTHAQNLISAVFGDFLGISFWASFTVVSFVLWLVVLGLFTKGGRGWCNLLCPAGALMGLFHFLGKQLRVGRSVQIDRRLCQNCRSCVSYCPAWAISAQKEAPTINPHACTACMDCKHVCPQHAIAYTANT